MIVYPNAKINIGLNVIKKRVDSYHDISSFLYPVRELSDILEIIPSDVLLFSSSGITVPVEKNICMRAYDLLKSDFGIHPVKIHLHKRIPIGAGLGGGSSDGAFTLVALNHIFDLNLSIERLERYALQLGADCPFFIQNKSRYVTGIGDKMSLLDLDFSDFELRFIFPQLHISTTEAYAEIRPQIPKFDLLDLIRQPLSSWKDKVKNDFEDSAFVKYPDLKVMKEKLYDEGAIYASMSGSGSVLYGLFERYSVNIPPKRIVNESVI